MPYTGVPVGPETYGRESPVWAGRGMTRRQRQGRQAALATRRRSM
uniref:Uncharacterized protein n=1 Tax=Verrucosispora sp. MS100047 TaxID=1410949 RepID=A0A097CTB0_9ACTN|nr:hypothetical protein VASRM7_654 [Verrucosispora sp. MS100047]